MIEFELIMRYMSGAASPDDAVLVDEWMNESDENKRFYQQLYDSWREAGSEAAYTRPDVISEWKKFQEKQLPLKTRSALSFTRITVAACLLAILSIGIFWYTKRPASFGRKELTAAASTNPLTVKLQDGTVVQLETKAVLHYPESFQDLNRKVKLEGDATFIVSPDKESPFIIDLKKDIHVKVLGTSFHIKQRADTTWLKVMTGKVAFYNAKDTIIANARQEAVYTAKAFALTPHGQYIKAKTGSFYFKNKTLALIAAELQAYYKAAIIIKNQELNSCRITAKLDHKTLEEVISIISATLNIQVQTNEGTIYLSGKGCN